MLNDPEKSNGICKWNEVIRFFSGDVYHILSKIEETVFNEIIEIRFRIGRPLEIIFGKYAAFIDENSNLVSDSNKAYQVISEDLKKIINSITNGSFYAIEEELTQGYLCLSGGHRVGFTGHVLQQDGKIRLIRNISSLNFRIARACPGIARPLLPYLWKNSRFLKTLILSPPACGKTTLLREIIREVSNGVPCLGLPGIRVGVVDERSEIAGSYQGRPQLDVGNRTDVLDACLKKNGVYLLLRSMNPQLIATDEIGREDDFKILDDITNAGVSFIATAHALDLTEAMYRPGLRKILKCGLIERLVFLSNRLGPGTIESIKAGVSGGELMQQAFSRVEKGQIND